MKQPVLASTTSLTLAAVVALWAAGAVGCGSSDRDGVFSPVAGEIGDRAAAREEQSASSDVAPDQREAKSVKKLMKGGSGGEVANGRYKVSFAEGAFPGEQPITVTNPKQPNGQVRLGPHGLAFSAEVTLSIALGGTVWDSPAATIDWWDPSAGVWVDMNGVYDPATRTVTAILPHFSVYRPRAGW